MEPASPEETRRRITIERETRPVNVFFHDVVLASTDEALLLKEEGHEPVYYIPRSAVATAFLYPSDHRTACPYKGEARYWSISAEARGAENAVWAYNEPHEGVEEIMGHMAFDRDQVDIKVG